MRRFASEIGQDRLFLLFLLTCIILYPLFFVGFTTVDDTDIANNYGLTTGLIETSRIIAQNQSRISFFWIYPLLRVPYLIDNQVWYLIMKNGAIVVLIASLYYSIFQIFKSKFVALASIVFFLAFIQNGWEYNALTSYPFSFNIVGASFLISLGLFSAAIDRSNVSLAILSGFWYLIALGSELFVLFYPFYIAVLLSRSKLEESIARRLASGKKYLLSVTLPLLIYLITYFLWRKIHPGSYDGNQFDGFSLLAAAKTIITLSLSALPLASLDFLISAKQQLLISQVSSWSFIISELGVVHFIKPAVSGFLFATLMTSTHFSLPKQRALAHGAAWAFAGVFIPNLLLGFVYKYQRWVSSGNLSYVYTYYSFISSVVFFALLAAYLKLKTEGLVNSSKFIFISICVTAVIVISFAVELRNSYIAIDQKLSNRKWELMNDVIRSPDFKEIPDGSIIVAPTLTNHLRGIAGATAEYWSSYTKYKTSKVVRFVNDKCVEGSPCYLLVFRQAARADNQFVILSKIQNIGYPVSTELVVFSTPKMANSVLMGFYDDAPEPPTLAVNGTPVSNVGSGFFSFDLPRDLNSSRTQSVHLKGNVPIFPEQITTSHSKLLSKQRQNEKTVQQVIDFRKPNYPNLIQGVQGMSIAENWGRWTDGPKVTFTLNNPLNGKFKVVLIGGAYGKNIGQPVIVKIGDQQQNLTFSAPPETPESKYLEFTLKHPASLIELTIPHPTIPEGGDRQLGLGLIQLRIEQ